MFSPKTMTTCLIFVAVANCVAASSRPAPAWPAAPVAPGDPADPAAPAAPAAPAGPRAPAAPVAPIAPAVPLGPAAPVSPVAPLSPEQPTTAPTTASTHPSPIRARMSVTSVWRSRTLEAAVLGLPERFGKGCVSCVCQGWSGLYGTCSARARYFGQ